jgi:hypothetical protein
MTDTSYTVSNYQITHLVAPARLARYMALNDPQGLDSDDKLLADRLLAEYGDVVSYTSRPRATRSDPAMAEFTFLSAVSA